MASSGAPLRGLLVTSQDHEESEKRIEAARLAHKAKMQARKDARHRASLTASSEESKEPAAHRPSLSNLPQSSVDGAQLVSNESPVANSNIAAANESNAKGSESPVAGYRPSLANAETTRSGSANTDSAQSRTDQTNADSAQQASSLPEVGRKGAASMSGFSDERRAKKPGTAGTKVPRSLAGGSARFHPYESSASQSATTSTTPESGARQFTNWKNPAWLTNTRVQQSQVNREVYGWLLQFRNHVTEYEASLTKTPQRDRLIEIRTLLHRIERFEMNATMVIKSRLIHDNQKDGLPQIFEGNRDAYPFDIRADAEILAIKWARKDFDPDIMRGIDFSRKTPRIRDDYHARVSPSQFGDETFVNGQWWPNRVTLFRDGAHGAWEAGIHGKAGEGAYSIVVSHNKDYDDRDSGDSLLYCGTQKKDDSTEDTASTQLLINSYEKTVRDAKGVRKRRPVRVFRTWRLDERNPFRPEKGIRYDGLYEVVAMGEHGSDMKRFKLERIAGQDPIRYMGPEKRPTKEEMDEFDSYRQTRYGE